MNGARTRSTMADRRSQQMRARRSARARKRSLSSRAARGGAQRSLRRFAQGTILAVAVTAFILLLFGADVGLGQDPDVIPETNGIEQGEVGEENGARALRPDDLAEEATAQARETFISLWEGFAASLPQLLVASVVLLLAWLFLRMVRPLLRRATGSLQKGPAVVALFGIAVWLLAIGVAVSVLAGDLRALLGSIGLIGLALSWALQTPIESFTGWLMNSFQGYYRVGDRIAVGDVFGDVVRVDFLTTTVWEYGGSDRVPGGVRAEQPTGRLITFPNNEVLTGSIVNLTRDFPYVWDELAVSVAEESELRYAKDVLQKVADHVLAENMRGPAVQYRSIIARSGIPTLISEGPEVFLTITDSGTDIVIRYLVGARERRRWKSDLSLAVLEEIMKPEHKTRILPLYPRQQLQLVGPDGAPAAIPGAPASSE